jgi:hypothetical protein
MPFVWPSLALFCAFFVAAAIDGLYFHFRRFRLWHHADTRTEHALHTARAVLMPPTIATLFSSGRATLLVAAVLVGLDFIASMFDVVVERRSRARFGGLPHAEYLTHVVATVFHVGAVTLAFAGRLSGIPAPTCALTNALVITMVAGASVVAVQHIVLLCRGLTFISNVIEMNRDD